MTISNELIKLSAQMTLCKNMPSKYHQDWTFPKGLQITAWRKVFDAADKAEKQCQRWALQIKALAEELEKNNPN